MLVVSFYDYGKQEFPPLPHWPHNFEGEIVRRVITKIDGLPDGLPAGAYIIKCAAPVVKRSENEIVLLYLAESVEPRDRPIREGEFLLKVKP